jgi:hypothetical protein
MKKISRIVICYDEKNCFLFDDIVARGLTARITRAGETGFVCVCVYIDR